MAREHLGLSASDVGRRLGITQQQVSNMEIGKAKIADKYRRQWSELLGIDRADLADWIAADEDAAHRRTKRELSETAKIMNRFVDQYQELGHTYRRLDAMMDRAVELLEEILREVKLNRPRNG